MTQPTRLQFKQGYIEDVASGNIGAMNSNLTTGSVVVYFLFKLLSAEPPGDDPVLGDLDVTVGTATLSDKTLHRMSSNNYDAGNGFIPVACWSAVVTSGGTHTPTFTTGLGQYCAAVAVEYSNMNTTSSRTDGANGTGVGFTAAGTAVDADAVAITSDGVIVGAMVMAGDTATITPDAAFTTIVENESNSNSQFSVIERLVTGALTDRAEWTLGSANPFSALVVGFKGASAGGSAVTGTGAINSSKATVAGSGKVGHSGSGAITSSKAAVAGTAVTRHTGTGAITSSKAGVSGAGTKNSGPVNVSGSGALTAGPATASGSGKKGSLDVPGAVDLTGPVATASGTGTAGAVVQHVTGTGAPAYTHATVAGVGKRGSRVNAPDVQSSKATVAGTGVVGRRGSGAIVSSKATVSGGTGPRALTGSGALTGPRMLVEGAGDTKQHLTGTGALTSSKAFLTAAALVNGVAAIGGDTLSAAMPSRIMAHKRSVRSAHGRYVRWQK